MTCIQTQTFNEPSCVGVPKLSKVTSAPHVPATVHIASVSHLAWTGANIEALLVVGVMLVAIGITILRVRWSK